MSDCRDDDAHERIDELNDRVADDADLRAALAALPNEVIEMHGTIRRNTGRIADLGKGHDRVRGELIEVRREIDGVRDTFLAELREFRKEVRTAHTGASEKLTQIATPTPKTRFDVFKDTMSWLGPIIVVLAAYYLASHGAAPTK